MVSLKQFPSVDNAIVEVIRDALGSGSVESEVALGIATQVLLS